ncbi:MAG TPA: peptidase [Terriglobia bacterium]|nr:peptidase [Terriglobia bacterium]
MRRITAVLAAAVLTGMAQAQSGARPKVGVQNRTFTVDEYDWRGAATHALTTVIWYPADAAAVEKPQWIGPPQSPLFSAGKAAPEAPPAKAPAKFPLIVLSHGTGGSALSIAWIGTALAAHGYIAAAVNHPGNNATEAYTAPGFSEWWERARDLSVVIDRMLSDSTFGDRIDRHRIGAEGFSLGGYTMIEIAGGITDVDGFLAFCKSPRADAICKSPPEFPDLIAQFSRLHDTDPAFQAALRQAGDSYRDPRVRAAFALAPALGPAFTSASLEKIAIPVEIVAGASDQNVPLASSARYFAAHIPGAKLVILPGGVAHYNFLDSCADAGRKRLPLLCTDAPGVNRDAVHARANNLALAFFAAHLK